MNLQPRLPASVYPALAILILSAAGTALANPGVYRTALRSTVMIKTATGSGSGVVVDQSRRLVATNFHVVGSATAVTVYAPQFQGDRLVASRREYIEGAGQIGLPGRVLARDPRRDLALVELERLPAGLKAIPLAPASPQPAEEVHSIGNPGASDALWVYTSGTVRQVYRKKYITRTEGERSFQVDAWVIESQLPTNPGDSGGPILNNAGQLVGITQGLDREARLFSYGIDVSEVMALMANGPSGLADGGFLENLKKTGLPCRALPSGIIEIAPAEGQPRVFVTPKAKKAGGLNCRDIYAVARQLDARPAGEQVQKWLEQNGQETLGGWQLVKARGGAFKLIFAVQAPDETGPEVLKEIVRLVRDKASRP